MNDLTYTTNGIWARFTPTSDAGEVAYKTMMDDSGDACVFTYQLKPVLKQIRDAGYTVSKAKKATKKELNFIFDELEELGL